MKFWSKGLGRRTVSLRLRSGDPVKSGDLLYVRGSTEEPVVWDYAMMLASSDLVEFVTLLREPTIARFLYRSPRRWHLYFALATGALRFLGLLVAQSLRQAIVSSTTPEPVIVIPPPSDRGARGSGTAKSGARRRLGANADAGATRQHALAAEARAEATADVME